MLSEDTHQKFQTQLNEDLQFMLSGIRARENGLIFFLEKLKNRSALQSSQFKLSKNEFQQKQKIYGNQIMNILQKYAESAIGNLYQVRAFWIKLKTIIKVSIERISCLNLSKLDKIFELFDKALQITNKSSDSEKNLVCYRQVEHILRKRSIQVIIFGRNIINPSSACHSEPKIQKKRSQTLFKRQQSITRFAISSNQSDCFSKGETISVIGKPKIHRLYPLNDLQNIEQQSNIQFEGKMKSAKMKTRRAGQTKNNILNLMKAEQMGKLKSNSNAPEKYIKNICRAVQRYEKKFQGACDGRYDIKPLLDKKKTFAQNIYILYDELFSKNIPAHKQISKFLFTSGRMRQRGKLLRKKDDQKKSKAKKTRQKQNLRQKQDQIHEKKLVKGKGKVKGQSIHGR